MVEPSWSNSTLFTVHVGILRDICIIVLVKIMYFFWK